MRSAPRGHQRSFQSLHSFLFPLLPQCTQFISNKSIYAGVSRSIDFMKCNWVKGSEWYDAMHFILFIASLSTRSTRFRNKWWNCLLLIKHLNWMIWWKHSASYNPLHSLAMKSNHSINHSILSFMNLISLLRFWSEESKWNESYFNSNR